MDGVWWLAVLAHELLVAALLFWVRRRALEQGSATFARHIDRFLADENDARLAAGKPIVMSTSRRKARRP